MMGPARIRIWCAVAALAGLTPAVAQAPPGLQRILWLPAPQLADAARLERVRQLGFTGVQLPGGADPAPVRAAGLSFYLDQPAGKGLLEQTDEAFRPLLEAYERSRDPAVLVRPECLSDPAALDAAVARIVARIRAVGADGMRFVALGDEISVTRHGNPLDLCHSPHCQAAFRAFLQQRHGDCASLDRAWGTAFGGWEKVVPLTTDQIRRRELGDVALPANLRPWAEHREFMDRQLAAAVRTLREAVLREAPGVPCGLTGLQPPSAFGGHDYAVLLPGLTLAEAYDVGGATALARSLLPGVPKLATLGVPANGTPGRLVQGQLADWIAHGTAAVVVWNADTVLQGDGLTPFGQQVQAAFDELAAVARSCAGAEVQTDPVWIVESQASVRLWWMLDSAQDGMTWPRRLSSYEAAHSTSQNARVGWLRLLADLGLQARFVPEHELPERVLQQRPRCVVLPATIALPDRACQALDAYVKSGGVLLADHTPALYDEHLVRRPAGALDGLFGLQGRELRWDAVLVRQGAVPQRATLRSGLAVAERGLRADLAERQDDHLVFAEQRHGRGRAVCLNLAVCDYGRIRLDPAAVAAAMDLRARVRQVLHAASILPPFEVRGEGLPTCIERITLRGRDGRRFLVARLNALERPAMLAELDRRGRLPVSVSLPQPMRLRVVGRDEVLGPADRFDLTLDVWTGLFLEVVER